MSIESRIASLGLKLPSATSPLANYVPFRRTGNLLFLSGQIPKGVDENGSPLLLTGKLGQDFTVAQGQTAAKLCAINMIAQVKEACAGDLSRVRSVVKVEAFVNSTPEFKEHPQVVNGCSDLLVSVFGDDIGRHSRFAVGCSSLPLGVAVEIGAVFELAD
ncbi:translation initiation inhibitor, putative [Perkinsus marinus ATCC 50983]|uniref:Translation initiation inhibitor, putative n=1 Tax=Perkinsus marinus (strain ATCC 50983 / TXsc) TaxID=423536 RepID=C5KB75_PERM5|nr:translation initiation inhibitor, putative [Perkinsus marinus ATCC 50983]XP_002786607.1 translation initiation inhibitor, putative [Perkinsus marinus ATCC 50983]EER18401.1 translation initiation inhibitor, putative [Perkinsus marinus ATCC 50983]EER18403.1 translation initiation inhibitor, putative [Perkinsus marinus ATCC 50983]|eukprot:XP_002786605.1 translation initiation inhibitor, putative [Perkinsus marinus ATCC 50983]